MDNLAESKRRLHELEQQLAEVERGNLHVQVSDIYNGLTDMQRYLDDMDKIVSKESKTHREDYRRRVQHLKNSHHHIKVSLDSLVRRKNPQNFEAQKSLLFGSQTGDVEFGRVRDEDIAENSSLNQSHSMVRQYIAVGQETLNELISQRDRLKSVQRKVLDMVNYLGLSNSIMRAVENRDFTDKWIVIAGMCIILIFLFLVWFFVKR